MFLWVNVLKISLPMFMERRFEEIERNEDKEEYILQKVDTSIESKEYEKIYDLIENLPSIWKDISSLRMSKIIKKIVQRIPISDETYLSLLDILERLIEWASNKKMLSIDLRCKQIYVLLAVGHYKECLDRIRCVLLDLKKYDDKTNQVQLFVYESQAYYELNDLAKAKSALISARALAVSSACRPGLQAQIDLLNGMYLGDEHSFETAMSYLVEAFDEFQQDKEIENARVPLRYIILHKIVSDSIDELDAFLEGKTDKKFHNDEIVVLLRRLTRPCREKNILEYQKELIKNKDLITRDKYIARHLGGYYESLLNQNIVQLVRPYSSVKIDFIIQKLHLEEKQVEEKLRELILDGSIDGTLDHINRVLVLYGNRGHRTKNYTGKSMKIILEFFESS